jgi:hypothetical protein
MPDTRCYYDDGRDRSCSQEWGEEHIFNGEMRFPSAMSYASDAQRSDVATVCSGSVVEDIELESVLSQDDERLPGTLQGTPVAGVYVAARRSSSVGNRVVEFTEVSPSKDSSLSLHNMGPPLNRTLLLQREYASSQTGGSVKSYGSYTGSDGGGAQNAQYSDDCESTHSQEGIAAMDEEDGAALPAGSASRAVDDCEEVKLPGRDTSSQAGSVKSYGSNAGSAVHSDTDCDCGGSLDVETHSVGTRSIHSQDEAPPVAATEEPEAAHALLSTAPVENGRRSPGGTIYKGRGTRRYQGRYMHLPLKRFHQNGVHLDEDEHQPPSTSNIPTHEHDGIHPDWNDPRRKDRMSRPRRNGHRLTSSPGRRSRSRSRDRSPTSHDDDDDERKPKGRRSNSSRQVRGYKEPDRLDEPS